MLPDAPGGTPCPDDGDECTTDTCDGSGVCQHPVSGSCGACCLVNKDCVGDILPDTCVGLGGTHAGAGTACLGDSDGDGVDDLCDNCPGVDDFVYGVRVCCVSGAQCDSDAECGPGQSCQTACTCPGTIPTVSHWGLLVLALLLMVVAKVGFGRRAQVA